MIAFLITNDSPEMQEFVKELKLLVSSSSEGCSLPETESDSNVIECMMRHVYSSGREAACLEELTIQVRSHLDQLSIHIHLYVSTDTIDTEHVQTDQYTTEHVHNSLCRYIAL